MIRARILEPAYLTELHDGCHTLFADTTVDKGGQGAGLRPHDLLEAALAACLSMTARMAAEHYGFALGPVEIQVRLDRSQPDTPCYGWSVSGLESLAAADRDRLLAALENCPVKKTLSRPPVFRRESPAEDRLPAESGRSADTCQR